MGNFVSGPRDNNIDLEQHPSTPFFKNHTDFDKEESNNTVELRKKDEDQTKSLLSHSDFQYITLYTLIRNYVNFETQIAKNSSVTTLMLLIPRILFDEITIERSSKSSSFANIVNKKFDELNMETISYGLQLRDYINRVNPNQGTKFQDFIEDITSRYLILLNSSNNDMSIYFDKIYSNVLNFSPCD